eukprot:COSAG02_NODE_69268_length_199_cov_27.490000_1_plen_42_part_10
MSGAGGWRAQCGPVPLVEREVFLYSTWYDTLSVLVAKGRAQV